MTMTLLEKYNQLLEDYKQLQANVNCDFYEAYLLEKEKVRQLEEQLNKKVEIPAGWEYYG